MCMDHKMCVSFFSATLFKTFFRPGKYWYLARNVETLAQTHVEPHVECSLLLSHFN
jgi:hypothetical protein